MHNTIQISEGLYYVGGSDRTLSRFENLYPVPRGMAYNSYLLLDEKTVLFDTVDETVADLFLENVAHVLGGRTLDYLVVHHMEPDHSATILRLLQSYPTVTVVASAKALQMMENFFPFTHERTLAVKEGDVLKTGEHSLSFIGAPMVHWPEVLFSFDEKTCTLFSADAFGTFGALDGHIFADETQYGCDFSEARRYYFNIVGKYGVQVRNVLKKAAELPIETVCPLHGPIWRKNFGTFLKLYDVWSKYEPEERGAVLFYGSIHGHTAEAAQLLASAIAEHGARVEVLDVSAVDLSELVAEAFRFSHPVFLSATYNLGIFLPMEQLLSDLGAHLYQNRKYAVVENGSWSPQAGSLIENIVSGWKNMERIGERVTILSSVKEAQAEALRKLGERIAEDIRSES